MRVTSGKQRACVCVCKSFNNTQHKDKTTQLCQEFIQLETEKNVIKEKRAEPLPPPHWPNWWQELGSSSLRVGEVTFAFHCQTHHPHFCQSHRAQIS